MILPITLTGRLGLPAQGVPNFSLDSSGNVIGSDFWPSGDNAAGVDPATGEPPTSSSFTDDGFTNDASLWDPSSNAAITPTSLLNVAPLRDSRGTQWSRRGSYSTESQFDKWRRAGRPTSCSLGDWAGTLQQAITAGIVGADAANLPAGSVVQSGPNGITIATPASVSYPGGIVPYVPGQGITATATASPVAWILGIAIVGGLFYAVTRR